MAKLLCLFLPSLALMLHCNMKLRKHFRSHASVHVDSELAVRSRRPHAVIHFTSVLVQYRNALLHAAIGGAHWASSIRRRLVAANLLGELPGSATMVS